jgi:hypothetical protein
MFHWLSSVLGVIAAFGVIVALIIAIAEMIYYHMSR